MKAKWLHCKFLVIVISAVLVSCASDREAPFSWKQGSTAKMKEKMSPLLADVKASTYGNIDQLFISRNDTVLLNERFYLNYDSISHGKSGKMGCGSNTCTDTNQIHIYNYYHPKYHPYYELTDLHSLQSVTKSIVSLLVGVVVEDGKLEGTSTTVLPFFSDYDLSAEMTAHLQKTTLEDLLTMRMGIQWTEAGLSLEDTTDVSAMELSDDWVKYVLEQPIADEPGTTWNYSSGATQLLSHILRQATGLPISEYAQQTLFRDLDIQEHYWKVTPTGLPDTEGGLYLAVEDLAKIGLLYANNGKWQGRQLVPESWIRASSKKHTMDLYADGGKEGYGYQWWLTAQDPPMVVGLGYGNQILIIIPDRGLVGIVYAWNVFDQDGKYIISDFLDMLESL